MRETTAHLLLTSSCNGKAWRSINVISQSSSGIRVSQSITQYLSGTDSTTELAHVFSDQTLTSARVGRPRVGVLQVPGLPTGIMASRATNNDGGDPMLQLGTAKLEYVVTVLEWGYGSDEQTAIARAARVLQSLLARVPDKLNGPLPNPDSIGNKYWDVKYRGTRALG